MVDGLESDPQRSGPLFSVASVEHAQTRAAAAQALFGTEEPVQVGRFELRRRIGAGGMGVVFAGYDPQLCREVAIKILTSRDDRSAARLLREAQAMAKLSHPNLVQVFEVGQHDGDVFLAMELVDGPNLAQWLRAEKRSMAQILDVFGQAARGLASIHDAGLVHRDFKPTNILVGGDARVRIVDFGLARSGVEDSIAVEGSSSEQTPDLQDRVTETGAVAGTPAYMAPEVKAGAAFDAHSDQYSFFVTLYESLAGRRPDQSGIHGKLPRWLSKALQRGLSEQPDHRFADMHQVASALQRRRLGRAGTMAVVGAAAAVAGVLTWGITPAESPCDGGRATLAEIWSPDRAGRIAAAFSSVDRPFAQDSWQRLKPKVDAVTTRWSQAHREACMDTRVRGEQSEHMLDLRMACLDRSLRQLDAVLETFEQADAKLVRKAPEALTRIDAPESCSRVESLGARMPLPDDPDERAELDQLQTRLAQTESHILAGTYEPGAKEALEIANRAGELGYPPLRADALVRTAYFEGELGRLEDAETRLNEAIEAATKGRDDVVAGEAWAQMVRLLGVQQARYEEGALAARAAQAAIDRAGGDRRVAARVAYFLGGALVRKGDVEAGKEQLQRSLELWRSLEGGDSLNVGRVLNSLGNAYHRRNELKQANATYEESRAVMERVLGRQHPMVTYPMTGLAFVRLNESKYEEARDLLFDVLEIRRQSLRPGHQDIGHTHNTIGNVLYSMGKLDQATDHYQKALKIREEVFGTDNLEVGETLNNLGAVANEQERYEDAKAYLQRSLAINAKAHGDDHPSVAYPLVNLAEIDLMLGEPELALEQYDRALRIWQRSQGPDHPLLGHPLMGKGLALVELGRTQAAIEALQRSLDVRETGKEAPRLVADSKRHLGTALWKAGRRKRAVELLTQARSGYQAVGDQRKTELEELDGWLRSNGLVAITRGASK